MHGSCRIGEARSIAFMSRVMGIT